MVLFLLGTMISVFTKSWGFRTGTVLKGPTILSLSSKTLSVHGPAQESCSGQLLRTAKITPVIRSSLSHTKVLILILFSCCQVPLCMFIHFADKYFLMNSYTQVPDFVRCFGRWKNFKEQGRFHNHCPRSIFQPKREPEMQQLFNKCALSELMKKVDYTLKRMIKLVPKEL